MSDLVARYCEETFRDGKDYKVRTQDFTDSEFHKAFLLVKPRNWEDLADYLEKLTDDPDVKAHLLGFNSAQERAEMLTGIKRKQEGKSE